MPDGLEMFPLDGGKLEIVQDLLESQGDLEDDELGEAVLVIYCRKYDALRDLSPQELAEEGRKIALEATLEDRQAAEEVILADFDALQSSLTSRGKQSALVTEEQDRSLGHPSSEQDSASDTAEKNSTTSLQSRSSRSHLPKSTETEQKGTPSNGSTSTQRISEPSEGSLTGSKAATGRLKT